jgi:hypothetical protein
MSFYEESQSYEILSHDGGPCIVCGTSGGNCRGEINSVDQIRFVPKALANDPFATFIVPERIYEEYFDGSKVVKKLIYPKGARIRPDEARRLGLLP